MPRRRCPWKKLIAHMKVSSRRRYHPGAVLNQRTYAITVTAADLERIYHEQGGKCFWLGVPIDPASIFTPQNPMAMSCDRLNNHLDYTESNVVITTRFVNVGRGNCPALDFWVHIDRLRSRLVGEALDEIVDLLDA
jgi:hypothetical protein